MATYGEQLLALSTLDSGSSARDHFMTLVHPEIVYKDGEKKVYVIQDSHVSGVVAATTATANVVQPKVSGYVNVVNTYADVEEFKLGEN